MRERTLLVADNFEHVLDAAHTVAALLAAGPGVRVLATSRAPLAIYGEHRLEVSPLALDEEAVPLFVARADASAPRFQARASEQVAAVCERLDRLPLAIELAAARAGEVRLDEMGATLSRLELASRGPRDRDARQQTLRGTIAWSVDLLDPRCAKAFLRLELSSAAGWTRPRPRSRTTPHDAELEQRSLLGGDRRPSDNAGDDPGVRAGRACPPPASSKPYGAGTRPGI